MDRDRGREETNASSCEDETEEQHKGKRFKYPNTVHFYCLHADPSNMCTADE